jgi:hypothetical protein
LAEAIGASVHHSGATIMSDAFSSTANLDVVFPAGGGPVQLTEAQIAAVAGGYARPDDGPPVGVGTGNGLK